MNETVAIADHGEHPAYKHGKMDPATHFRIVNDLDRIANEVGVTPADITGQNYHLTDFERNYLTRFRRLEDEGALGLIYTGTHHPPVFERCRSICGALTRNFIEARFIPREELINRLFSNQGTLRAELVAVPDFHYADANAATRRALASWLIGRAARGKQTVLGLPKQSVIQEIFGSEAPMYLKHFEVQAGAMA